jgi:hypothetical protein
LVPDVLSSLLTDEAFAIVARYPDQLPPPWFAAPNHEFWRYVRRWCARWDFDEAAAVDELEFRVQNTVDIAAQANQNGEPLPTAFWEPERIFVKVGRINKDDGTIEDISGTPLALGFLKPSKASSLFRWDPTIETRARAMQHMMATVRADLKRAMDEVEALALAAGAIRAPTKREAKHFEWTVRAKMLGHPYSVIARSETSPRQHRLDDEANPTIDANAVSREVRKLCRLLGITPPQGSPEVL